MTSLPGNVLDAPSMDGLIKSHSSAPCTLPPLSPQPPHRYDVSIVNGRVVVAIPASGTGSQQLRAMSKRDPSDSRV